LIRSASGSSDDELRIGGWLKLPILKKVIHVESFFESRNWFEHLDAESINFDSFARIHKNAEQSVFLDDAISTVYAKSIKRMVKQRLKRNLINKQDLRL